MKGLELSLCLTGSIKNTTNQVQYSLLIHAVTLSICLYRHLFPIMLSLPLNLSLQRILFTQEISTIPYTNLHF